MIRCRAMRLLILLVLCTAPLFAAKPLNVYFIDVEGGQATLIVSPSGQSLLIDTGWPGQNGRDAERIAQAAKAAKLKRIDYVLITHYHTDHVGGVPQLVNRFPVGTFVDHGPNQEQSKAAEEEYRAYEQAAKGRRLIVKPGDTVPIKGMEIRVLTAAGERLSVPLPGGGQPNPSCASARKKEADPSENARSLGTLITFGDFRLLDLGDLTWNKELELVCPANPIGAVDVYVTTHHGLDQSNPPQMLAAIRPRVAIMNNGARKGGAPSAWQIIRNSPGLQDLWQLHFAVAGGKEHNSPDSFIANVDENCEGKWIKLTAQQDGSFSVTNSRNKYEKSYGPRGSQPAAGAAR